MSIKGITKSASFRVVGLYVFFYLITVSGFLWLMFSVMGSEIENSIKVEIEREHAQIIDRLDKIDSASLVDTLRSYSAKANPLEALYIIKDESGETILSNYVYEANLKLGWVHLRELDDKDEPLEEQDEDDDDDDFFDRYDFDFLPERANHKGYIGWVSAHDGQLLCVGRSLDRLEETREIFIRIALMVLPVSLLLAIFGGYVFSRITTRRIEVINNQCRTIRRKGDLSLRVPNDKPEDEYGLLIANINSMLEAVDKGVRNLQEFSDDVAHDLRTPLTRIKYGLETGLLNPKTTKKDLQAVLQTTLSETDSLLETFSAILRISQINTGLRKSRFQVFDLTDLMDTVAEAYEPIAEEKGHVLTTSSDGHTCLINGDKDMIGQLMSNLLENTFQHAGEKLTITITITCNPFDVTLSVQDNGKGIPTTELENIFNKFYRIDKSRSEIGRGLGLAIVKAVSDLHDGGIQVGNCNPGAKFSISFPRNIEVGE